MPGALVILLFVLGLILVAVVAYYSHKLAQQRREEMANLARELGFQFDPDKDASHDEEYAHFEIFRRGHSRAAYNTLTGSIDVAGRALPAKMGDFIYKVTSGSGKNRRTQTYRFSYLIVHLQWGDGGVPDLLIRPEGMFDKLAGVFGFDDIDFESAEFSRRFHVKSPDKKFAYDVCHPRMMEFLLRTSPPCIDIERGRSCLSAGSGCWGPEEFRARVGWIGEFLQQWPDHVTRELERA